MENITSISCNDFVTALASSAPVPGGGGASAVVGSIGMALGNMVGSLTVGKKKYAAVEDEVKELMAQATSLQNKLLELAQQDAVVFEPLAKAYGLPATTPEEIQHKKEVMEDVLVEAAEVPLEIMQECLNAIKIIEIFAKVGSVMAISDAGVGATVCRAGLQGASLNVYINTKAMQNREVAATLNKRADQIMKDGTALADKIFHDVYNRLV